MPSEVKMGVIIPTKDRPDDVRRLLKEISVQDARPDQIIIVDGGSSPINYIVAEFPSLRIDYLRQVPPSLTAQRNAGIRAVRKDVSVVVFFDDDIILEDNALSSMMKFWRDAPKDIGGAAFNLVNEAYKKPTFMEKVFMVNSDTPLSILKSGFQGKTSCVEETRQAAWLVGCAMAWRRDVFKEFIFDEWFSGYGRYEEVDFSYRVGKKYKMFIVADARVRHYAKLESIDISFSLGRMETLNRLYFVCKNAGLSVPLCCWSLFGVFLNNVLKGVVFFDKRCLRRAMGNTAGLMQAIFRG